MKMIKGSVCFVFALVATVVSAHADLFSSYAPTGNTFTVPSSAYDVSGGLIYYVDQSTLYRQDGFNSSSFTAVGHLGGSYSANSFPSFVEFSPDGSRVAIGNGGGADFGTYQVAVFDASQLNGSNPDLAPSSSIYGVNHFSAVWGNNTQLYLSAGSFGSPGVVTRLDTTSSTAAPVNTAVINNIGGASAGVALDAAGNLFTGNGFDGTGPSDTGWIKAVLAAAWQTNPPVDFEGSSSSVFVADLLSAGSLAFDAEGNLLVGGGDFGSDSNFFALISGAAINNLLSGYGPIDVNNPAHVRKLDPSSGSFSYYTLAVDSQNNTFYALDGTTAYQYCAVPEASTSLLILIGLGLVAWRAGARAKRLAWVGGAILLLATAPGRATGFFAEEVIDYSPGPGVTEGTGFGITSRILGGPRGGGSNQASTDALSLGQAGSVTLGFGENWIENGAGADFIVFENPLVVGSDPNTVYAELFFVEVSSDGTNFARFDSLSLNPGPIGPFGTMNRSLVSGLGGTGPVLANVDTNSIDPFDPNAAGGNAFDLSALSGHSLVLSGSVQLDQIRFLRLVDVFGNGGTLDSSGNPIYDPTGPDFFGSPVSADLDAVAVIHGVPEPSTHVTLLAGFLLGAILIGRRAVREASFVKREAQHIKVS